MIINNKYIYLCFPRTGTHFIRNWLYWSFDVKEAFPLSGNLKHHIPITLIKDREKYFTWGMIRNPFDFYVSWWSKWSEEITFEKWLDHRMHRGTFGEFKVMKKFDIGHYTWWFIVMFCDYKKLFVRDSLEDIDLKKEILADKILFYEDFANGIIEMFKDNLEPLTQEQIKLLKSPDKVLASEHNHFSEYYDKSLKNLILYKDRLIFKIFPQYL